MGRVCEKKVVGSDAMMHQTPHKKASMHIKNVCVCGGVTHFDDDDDGRGGVGSPSKHTPSPS